MPEDSASIDLAEVPGISNGEKYDNADILGKVYKKFAAPFMREQRHASDDCGSDSGGDV
jgi:hypothetical protein